VKRSEPTPNGWLRNTCVRSSVAALLLAVSGCTGSAQPPLTPSRFPSPPLLVGSAEEYVPAAGLRWLFAADVAELAARKDLLEVLEPVVPKERLALFGKASGFELRRIKRLVIAGFDYSTLYVVETEGDNSEIETRFMERLRHEPLTTHPHPQLTTTTGIAGGAPQRMVRLLNHLVAISVGDPTPARAVEAYARHRLKKSPSVFKGAAFGSLPSSLLNGKLLFFAPGPFKEEWASGALGLFQAALALGARADFQKASELLLSVSLAGSFGHDPAAPDRLLLSWKDVSESSLGHLLGLHEPTVPPRVTQLTDSLRLDVTLRTAPIVAGLYAAVGAEVWQFLELNPKNSSVEKEHDLLPSGGPTRD